MLKPVHFMIDNETLSCKSNAFILSVGIVHFDPQSFEVLAQKQINVCPAEEQPGAHIDPSTVLWWLDQFIEVQNNAFRPEDPVPLKLACTGIFNFIRDTCRRSWAEDTAPSLEDMRGAVEIWSNPPVFDVLQWENAMSRSEIPIPWQHYGVNNVRSLLKDAKRRGFVNTLVKGDKAHTPLEDCLYQIAVLKAVTAFNHKAK